MCEAHSKVSHIKQQKYFHHLKGCGYNTYALEVMKIFLLFYVRHFAMGLTNVVIKQQFFTFIFTVFLVNLAYSFR